MLWNLGRWAVQVLSTIHDAHLHYISLGPLDISDIVLISDFTVVSELRKEVVETKLKREFIASEIKRKKEEEELLCKMILEDAERKLLAEKMKKRGDTDQSSVNTWRLPVINKAQPQIMILKQPETRSERTVSTDPGSVDSRGRRDGSSVGSTHDKNGGKDVSGSDGAGVTVSVSSMQ